MHGPPQITPKRKKVYCRDCVHIRFDGRGMLTDKELYICTHPNNIKEFGGNWYKPPPPHKEYKRRPKKINKKNTCLWYEKKKTSGGNQLL
jgi:hypothetical protein